MARQRMIKPEFFRHDELAELPPLHRLLFIGLWTLADREGRLEDRPKRIKVEVLPWDDVDVAEALAGLEEGGFIHRYEAEGRRYIYLPSFLRHQRPHPKEAPSIIPSPPSREEVMPSREREGASSEGVEPSREKVLPDVTPRNIKGREKVLPSREKDMTSQSESESESESESVVVGVAEPPPLTLEPTKPEKPPRKLSTQQRFWAWAQNIRAEEGMLPDSGWPVPKINKLLAWVADHPPEAVTAAYGLFLDDERMQEQSPPCPMAFFANDWPKWMDMAEREGLLDPPAPQEAVSP